MFFSRHSKYKILLTLLFCSGFLLLLWHSYYVYVDNTKTDDLPIIRASKGIIFKPKDPGGIVIPDKDKDIYNSMSGRASKPESMRIERDEPEQVITKAEALALIEKQLRAQGIKPQLREVPAAQAEQPIAFATSKPELIASGTAKPESMRESPPQLTKPATTTTAPAQATASVTSIAPAATPVTPAPTPQVYYLRVAKITSPEVFEQAVAELKKTYPLIEQLPAKLAAQSVDGISKYYVHLGPVTDFSKAQDVCRRLETLGKACRVIASGK